MRQRTELMESILTSKEAQKIIDYLSPVYGEAYVFLWLLQSIGIALDEGVTAIEEYSKQVTPYTATWTLSFWEKEYDIIPDPYSTMEDRREAIVAAMQYRSSLNPKKLENILSSILGKEVLIYENTGKNKFSVYVKGFTTNTRKAIEAIERAKPAHLIYDILFSDYEEVTVNSYNGVTVAEHESVQINVI